MTWSRTELEAKHTGRLWVALLTQQEWPALGHFRSYSMSPEKALMAR